MKVHPAGLEQIVDWHRYHRAWLRILGGKIMSRRKFNQIDWFSI